MRKAREEGAAGTATWTGEGGGDGAGGGCLDAEWGKKVRKVSVRKARELSQCRGQVSSENCSRAYVATAVVQEGVVFIFNYLSSSVSVSVCVCVFVLCVCVCVCV